MSLHVAMDLLWKPILAYASMAIGNQFLQRMMVGMDGSPQQTFNALAMLSCHALLPPSLSSL